MPARPGSHSALPPAAADAGTIDDVVRRAQHGDVQAFETLYRTHAPAIYALCRRMVGDESAARDLVQDVFVRAWERLPTFRGQSALATWMHRLAVNVVLEQLRSTKRDVARFLDDADQDALPARPASPDIQMDLDRAVAQLPTGARTVFVLHDVHGYSHDEIAQMTGIAAGTARAQLFRARRALMRLLDL
ncbi:MAG TPA: sigma-70 family RNA polymerase sigma factor [Gemmatimonadaceae bacterium]